MKILLITKIKERLNGKKNEKDLNYGVLIKIYDPLIVEIIRQII